MFKKIVRGGRKYLQLIKKEEKDKRIIPLEKSGTSCLKGRLFLNLLYHPSIIGEENRRPPFLDVAHDPPTGLYRETRWNI